MKISTTICCALLMSASLSVQADPITRSEARLVAQQLVGINDTSSDDNAPLSPYYIFSRGAGKGFVIVSGDDSTAPILGYTEQGDFDIALLPPQLQSMLKLWNERIAEVQQKPQAYSYRISAPRRAIAEYKKSWTNVTPLLKTHWHQSEPYNILAPIKTGQGRCMTGCVATSGSQVAYYFRKDNPAELSYDTPTYSYGTPITVSLPKGTPIEWDLMKLSGTGTAKQDSAVAKLMYALGTSAYLTYGDGDGLATSGHNEKMGAALKGQFRLNYSHKGKSEYSQQKWEELIYQNLASRRPMLYAGSNAESGGHSVCLDGYQASTGLYHFNFGWGGQGDGYYTVDDATGMNGFNSYQELVFNITPQIQNLSGDVLTSNVFHKASTDVEVTISNDGTLDYQGVYLYVNNKNVISGTPVDKDLNTILEAGKSVSMTFSVNTTLKDSAYLVLCDKSRHIFASKKIDITPTVADLHLKAITVDAGTAATTVDDIEFQHVNNTTATVTVTLENGSQGTYCQPNMQCYLQKYDTASKSWTNVKNIIQNTYTFDANQTRQVDFVFSGLSEGVYYRAYLNNKAVASSQSIIAIDTDETYTYFTVFKSDLALAIDGRTAIVTGHWNAPLFSKLATSTSVCSYDISGLVELNEKPVAPNPNALFYTAAENTSLQNIENVVVGDVCERLNIQTGADFNPMRPFTARHASLALLDAEPGKWHGALIPFAADVPYGMQVKQAKEYTTKGLATINHEATRSLQPMTVVTYITSRPELNSITASDVTIVTDTMTTLFDGILQAYTVSIPLESQSLVLGEYIGSLYFVAPETDQTMLDAFQPVVVGATAKRVRTTSETLADGYYRTLSTAIAEAHAALDGYVAPAAARQTLLDELKIAEDMLSYRSHEADTDIKDESSALDKAVKAFLEAASEPVLGDVNGDGIVDVADIASIISVMAGDTISNGVDIAKTADVNADGSVDVADIATVISVMAGEIVNAE